MGLRPDVLQGLELLTNNKMTLKFWKNERTNTTTHRTDLPAGHPEQKGLRSQHPDPTEEGFPPQALLRETDGSLRTLAPGMGERRPADLHPRNSSVTFHLHLMCGILRMDGADMQQRHGGVLRTHRHPRGHRAGDGHRIHFRTEGRP